MSISEIFSTHLKNCYFFGIKTRSVGMVLQYIRLKVCF